MTHNSNTFFTQVNGKLTLGENIADNGGIRLSIHAYEMYKNQLKEPEKLLPGLQDMTPEQLFFIGAGQTWCKLATPEQEVLQLLSDPHSPGKYRYMGQTYSIYPFYDIALFDD